MRQGRATNQVRQGQGGFRRQLVLVVDRSVQNLPLELQVRVVILRPGTVNDGFSGGQVDCLADWLDYGLGRCVHTFS